MEATPLGNGEMSHNEDARTAEEEEGVVSIKEYVEGLEAQELEVDMILGGDEGKECTYPKGYLSRQAVFSCITCCPEGNAGVCTACSMNCHDGHEVVEIWTRRHFRCDCGNSKFGIGVCRLFSSKDTENNENLYNQNFKGVYCTCKRPYPDPDATEDQGEMLQCCICEDWFHEIHLGLAQIKEVPRDEDGEPLFDEVICQACAGSLDFLSHYSHLLVPITKTSTHKQNGSVEGSNLSEVLTVVSNQDEANGVGLNSVSKTKEETTSSSVLEEAHGSSKENAVNIGEDKLNVQHVAAVANGLASASAEAENDDANVVIGEASDAKLPGCVNAGAQVCKLLSGQAFRGLHRDKMGSIEGINESGSNAVKVWTDKALFLVKNWRSQLCWCDACREMYVKKSIGFLLDPEDTLTKYEEVAKQKRKEKMDASDGQDLAFLDNLSHVGKIEFLHGLNEMTTEFSSFLASCEAGKTITSADIYEFFDNLKKKRSRLE